MSFEYTPPTITFELKGGDVTLRGLNGDDLGSLIARHGDAVDLLVAEQPDFGALISKAPAMVADIIALAADEPQAAHVVRQMPAPMQIALLIEVVKLTFVDLNMGEVFRLFVEAITKGPMNPPEATSPAI